MAYPSLEELKEADLKKLDDLDSSNMSTKIKMDCARCGKSLKGPSRFCSSDCEEDFYNESIDCSSEWFDF